MSDDFSFYLSVINGKIETKIRHSKRDLILAFRNGSLAPYLYKPDVLKVYHVDLNNMSVTQVSLKDIKDILSANDILLKEKKERERIRKIQQEIKLLEKQLKKGGLK